MTSATAANYDNESEMQAKLVKGWDWLKDNPNHPGADAFFNRWLDLLGQYTSLWGMIRPHVDLPEPSPWIGELAGQLGLDLAPDYKPGSDAVAAPSATKPKPSGGSKGYISDRG